MQDTRSDIEKLLAEKTEIEQKLKSQFSKKVTVMFSDIKDSTSFYDTQGDLEGRAMVHKHNELVIPCITGNSGVLLKTIGDATFSYFEKSVDGLRAACEMQKTLHVYNKGKTDKEQIHIKIGLNYGAGFVEEKDIYGDVVNVASRVVSLAPSDGILVTEDLYREARNNDEFIFRYVDAFQVKGKKEEIKVFNVVWHEEDLYLGKLRKAKEPVRQKEGVFILEAALSGRTIKVSGFERNEGDERPVKNYKEVGYDETLIKGYTSNILDLLNRANRRGKIGNDLLVKLKEYGRLLFDELIPPQIKERLTATTEKNLMISIDDMLVHVPWELLHDGKDFLCQRFAMGRTVSTRQQVSAVARAIGQPLKMQILADPTGDLPASYQEGIAIKDEIGKLDEWVDVTLRTTDIRKDYVKSKIRNFDILHYAGHGEHDSANPERSGWVLHDGILNAREVMNLVGPVPMPALVFSNACQTGQTDQWRLSEDYGEKIFGLANAFLLTGVQHYVGTFWEIPDEAGSHFALEFYKNLMAACTIGEAVRRAKGSLIDRYGEDTIVWASYVLYGDPTSFYAEKAHETIRQDVQTPAEKPQAPPSGLRGKEEVINFSPERKSRAPLFVGGGLLLALIIAGVIFFATGSRQETGQQIQQAGQTPNAAVAIGEDSSKKIDEMVTDLAKRYKAGGFEQTRPVADDWTSRPVTLVFMDINYSGGSETPVEKLVNLLTVEIQKDRRAQVVERKVLSKLLQELKLSTSQLADPATSLRLGKLFSARVIVNGIIMPEKNGLAMMFKCIDTETTTIRKVLTVFAPSREPDSQALGVLGKQFSDWIKDDFPIQGKILSLVNDRCELNIGQTHGIRKGLKLEVLAPPGKGGSIQVPVAELEITAAEKERSQAVVVKKQDALRDGLRVREL